MHYKIKKVMVHMKCSIYVVCYDGSESFVQISPPTGERRALLPCHLVLCFCFLRNKTTYTKKKKNTKKKIKLYKIKKKNIL